MVDVEDAVAVFAGVFVEVLDGVIVPVLLGVEVNVNVRV